MLYSSVWTRVPGATAAVMLDRGLPHVGQHAQDHLAAALDQAEDGRLVLRQRSARHITT